MPLTCTASKLTLELLLAVELQHILFRGVRQIRSKISQVINPTVSVAPRKEDKMWIGYVTEKALEVLVPSWGEINVSLAAAVLLVLVVSILQHTLVDEQQGTSNRGRKGALPGEFEVDGNRYSDMLGHDPNSSTGGVQSREVSP